MTQAIVRWGEEVSVMLGCVTALLKIDCKQAQEDKQTGKHLRAKLFRGIIMIPLDNLARKGLPVCIHKHIFIFHVITPH